MIGAPHTQARWRIAGSGAARLVGRRRASSR
jgi:hypothetical protein